ncbi:sugar phosphate isomerase/epimerase [Haloferax mediterranei ATCC 33500]|uniref:AP-endonuclease/AP-lyase / DNA-(Apurinic or apyrimidinic site) lyase n=1 Tax=Haloferax mediterranei (strain ATCC 33500 / DSM 1411 / JCM 8866 / NBRC 14739 / NCIMB 2177 / R-4) TaxID=523841 RepID=I3R838_HALMT|nr:sugar phosphate isomerase/epimerase [Haloferax mediterranei]AFK20398.1 AP-endonuclease/AP-lyase / DNA-(apurinic or apyrimidinic site) lyase [Haloferax mediterranei ATCC 33500]AHZ23762.1 xylose isomerase [Haloferax mediterranei ATCC 33500]ELZ99254.1 AP-endonuclease/AP-lyase / DNA-(apurinic or apyrimidinic site) lyase [Haloferax mediterranei ATCC 33500]MDX5986846.1 sugar phosphate isomerase/epimerase [Haloferax mediterranei ATCC 33500]QCQ76170.1 sugar phosphate isomerase/epimerase [Haloferax 
MYIGVLTVPLGNESLADALDYLSGIGVEGVELGVGGWPGEDHVDRAAVLGDDERQAALLAAVEEREMQISALATHNNPLHPDEETAAEADEELREAIELASVLDVNTVTCFSGLPAGGPNDEVPNWITAPWPTEHADAHEYQWDVAIDYWSDLAEFADDHGVDMAIEMHPNMLVYEPTGMMRLREATNERIGANFDPSHLYWQDIDVTEAIRFLGDHDAIHHFHAKDTKVYDHHAKVKGVLDTTSYTDTAARSWLFRSIGYGHDEGHWKDVVSTLRMVGYEGALSIEHEDALTSSNEGLEKAVDVLSRAVFETQPGEAYWAE